MVRIIHYHALKSILESGSQYHDAIKRNEFYNQMVAIEKFSDDNSKKNQKIHLISRVLINSHYSTEYKLSALTFFLNNFNKEFLKDPIEFDNKKFTNFYDVIKESRISPEELAKTGLAHNLDYLITTENTAAFLNDNDFVIKTIIELSLKKQI